MLKRKIIALLLSLSAALSLTTAAHAEDVTEIHRETVRVGNFDCWIENGEYYTELDGEIGLVIDIADLSKKSVDDTMSLANGEIWQIANPEVDLTDDKEYRDLINLSERDCFTPIFKIDTGEAGFASFQFSTKFILPNTYGLTVHTYHVKSSEWTSYSRKVIFSFAVSYVLFVDGTETPDVSKCCIYFHKDQCEGEKTFYYWAKQVKFK